MDELRKADFNGITYLQIHVHVGDLASDEPFKPRSEFLRTLGKELKSRGIVFQVLPWECSDQRAYEKLLGVGGGIVCDRLSGSDARRRSQVFGKKSGKQRALI